MDDEETKNSELTLPLAPRVEAEVRILKSYDYCHFEIKTILRNEKGISHAQLQSEFQTLQKLTDLQIAKYKKAKQVISQNALFKNDYKTATARFKKLEDKKEHSPEDKAFMRSYQEFDWETKKFHYSDDDYEIREGFYADKGYF